MYATTHPATRILAVLELLQSHGRLSSADLTARLEVDRRTVRRYVATLQDIGIPVEAERGRYGGYRLRPGFRLPPLMFTEDEALAVVLGLLAQRQLGLGGEATATQSALAKLGRVLPLALRARLGALGETLELAPLPARRPQPAGATLLTLSEAAHARRRVRLRYRSARGEDTERMLDPYGLVLHAGTWYAVGWDHLRDDLRVFRVDRVLEVAAREESFTRPVGFRALNHVMRSLATAPWRWDVEVLLDAPLAAVQERVPAWLATLEETPDGVVLYARAERLDGMARFLASLTCRFVVRRPAELGAELHRLAAHIAAQADRDP